MLNIKSLSLLDQKLWPKLYIWPLTLKNDLNLIMLPFKMCGFEWYMCAPHIKCLSLLDKKICPKLFIWPLTLKNDLDLDTLPLKMWVFIRYMCTPNIKCLSLLDQKLWPMLKWAIWPIFLPFTLKDDFDLDKLPLKMCGLMKYTYMSNV